MVLRRRRPRRDGEDGPVPSAQPDEAVPPAPWVAVVTDSTASLPPGAAGRWGVEVVPLEVALGEARYREGVDLVTDDLLAALTGGVPVTTSQPSPAAFAAAYARAAERGASAVVSVHLSGELSGTVRAAELAARDAPVPVRVVDSRTVAMGLGFAVLAAARTAAGPVGEAGAGSGAPAAEVAAEWATAGAGAEAAAAVVAERARAVAASAQVLFVVEGLEHLRRGGRIGSTAAAVGGLLGMRPLLTVRDGRVEVAGTVRTRRAARERLVDTVGAEVTRHPGSRVAVHHLARPDAGEELAAALRDRLAPEAAGTEVVVADVSAVVGAHAGPGLLGVVVAGP